jgi:hypothetical protein
MTRAETRFRLSTKRTNLFKSAGASIQPTTGSRGVRISGGNAGYTMFRGSMKSTGYLFYSQVSPSLLLSCVTVCHHTSTGFYSLYYCPMNLSDIRAHYTLRGLTFIRPQIGVMKFGMYLLTLCTLFTSRNVLKCVECGWTGRWTYRVSDTGFL